MSCFSLEWIVGEQDEGLMIKDFLKDHEISKAALTDIKHSGGRIFLNGEEVTVRFPLKKGDLIKVVFPPEEPSEGMIQEDIPLNIIYEDSYVLVVYKPAGMSTIPSREHPSGSLANALLGYYEKSGHQSTVHIVTRLDRDTSGLVLIAKHRHVHHLFSKQQKSGQVKRTYEAFVEGRLLEDRGTIEQPIARKKDSIIEREVNPVGQYACTHYRVLQTFPSFSHVELQLETGRTHQIRVHMAYLGHPLLGDDLYGGSRRLIGRQALHCCKLTFYHPLKYERIYLEIPLSSDMKSLI